MNHKRRRPKHQRAGCLMCKPWKDERGRKRVSGAGGVRGTRETMRFKPSEMRRLQEPAAVDAA